MFSSLSKKLWEVIKSLRQDTSGGKYIKPTVAPPSSSFYTPLANVPPVKVFYCQISPPTLDWGTRQNCYWPSIARSTGEHNYVKHL